ncbi:hypothetical protein N825_22735 [Skermanella stibiiresistens SB22]|uniref:Uncharacterized protein n=1 Tax=Skermanella stibiiresistens SB22 TaxID=1385369 RepID=W9GWA4_9PROT|nr:hypothetical protein N825_22735 [Skermanella stibiiresistens SB22]
MQSRLFSSLLLIEFRLLSGHGIEAGGDGGAMTVLSNPNRLIAPPSHLAIIQFPHGPC